MKEAIIITLSFLAVVFSSGMFFTWLFMEWLNWISLFEDFEIDLEDILYENTETNC